MSTMKMSKKRSRQLLQRLVDFARQQMFSGHRGAIAAHGRTFIFGNDGYDSCPCSKREVELLREVLTAKKAAEVAFATDTEAGHSWGMLIEGDHEDWANENLWSLWNQAWIEDGGDLKQLEFVFSLQGFKAWDEIEMNRKKVASMMSRA